jgi:hypothetical protein
MLQRGTDGLDMYVRCMSSKYAECLCGYFSEIEHFEDRKGREKEDSIKMRLEQVVC